MTTFQVIILAIVQGLTEFLPISSSGHLVLVPHFFDWNDQGLAFDAFVKRHDVFFVGNPDIIEIDTAPLNEPSRLAS